MSKNEFVAVSSRVRLARNLAGVPFPHQMDQAQAEDVKKKISQTLDKRSYNYVDIRSLPALDRQYLVERHMISPDLLKHPDKAAVLLKKDETVSLMINEEDHIRLQCMRPGLDLKAALDTARSVEKTLAGKLELAYRDEWGFITACPTNIGTGLRASVMLHLPALKMTKRLAALFSALNKVGLTVRGIYGEGTEALGDLYQLSNSVTLGQTDETLLANVSRAAEQLIDNEMQARNDLMKKRPAAVEDMVYRSCAVLKSARLLSSNEFMQLISQVRFGLSLGLLKDNGEHTADTLLLSVQPAGIAKQLNTDAAPSERDTARARIVREAMKNISE